MAHINACLPHTGVLWLTFDTGETLGVTPNHELWTYEDGWIAAAHVQPGDHLDHACGMAVAVVDRVYDPSPTFVYDLTVDGTWTFFAGELWVHNSSCSHHLATDKNYVRAPQWSQAFDEMFASAGMKLSDKENKLIMDFFTHRSLAPHSQGYHRWVFQTLQEALAGKAGQEERQNALKKALAQIQAALERDPYLLRQP
ncbi:MAG: AHH domain-containing protein [Phycisphaerae bacterium]|nr:AHH domain-containing protein [Phycisphaerae bacterium]